MKQIIICIIISAYFFAGCNNNTHKDTDHEHQQKETDVTDREHEDEIIFTEEKAQAAGIIISEIQPKTFRDVIKTSGQILAA